MEFCRKGINSEIGKVRGWERGEPNQCRQCIAPAPARDK